MRTDEFLSAAMYRAKTNVTDNVVIITASFVDGHLSVTFYLNGAETEDDEEWRDQCVGELIADFPEIKTAEDSSVVLGGDGQMPDHDRIVFQRTA